MIIPLQVALYWTELVDRAVHEGHSVSVIESVSYSIRWGGTSRGTSAGAWSGALLRVRRDSWRKQPLSHDGIVDITLSLNTTSSSLADILFLFILLASFPVNLRVKDITIFEDFVKTNLIKRKNDQHRDGHVSVLVRSCKPTCPVGITERLFS